MEELKALTEQIVADGGTPWCIGLGSGGATGWPATDWVEDLMLRTQPPEVYDQWVTNEIPFNDPRVVARDRRVRLVRQERQVRRRRRRGGRLDRLPRQPEGPLRLAAEVLHAPPGVVHPVLLPGGHGARRRTPTSSTCPAYADKRPRQAGARRRHARDASPRTRRPARAFIDFLKTPIAHEIWMAQSSFLTPFKGVNIDAYANDQMKSRARSCSNATTFRFDGSDLMPGKIGAGAFWTGMVDFVGGKSAQDGRRRDPDGLGRDQVVTLRSQKPGPGARPGLTDAQVPHARMPRQEPRQARRPEGRHECSRSSARLSPSSSASAAASLYFCGTNWLLDTIFSAARQGRRGGRATRRSPPTHPALAVPRPGAARLSALYLVYPVIETVRLSFFDQTGENFVGFAQLRLGGQRHAVPRSRSSTTCSG